MSADMNEPGSKLAWWRGADPQRVMPLFHHDDAELAAVTVDALHAGGAGAVEYTLRGPAALRTLSRLCARPGAQVGAGSVADLDTARAALEAGAAFLVGPNSDPSVAELCAEAGVTYVPGCLTPTEMVGARSWGCELVKLFPAGSLGPGYLRAVRGPLPGLQVMPTGGVDFSNLTGWLAAGAACVGMGSELVRRAWVEQGAHEALTQAMATALRAAGE